MTHTCLRGLAAVLVSLWLVAFFPPPLASSTPTVDQLKAELDAGGIRRKRAIWYVYQNERHELLPYIAEYLGSDEPQEDQLAVLHVMRSYKDRLERYLPNWIQIFDRYIQRDRPAPHLLTSIAIVRYFRENRLIHALLRLTSDTRSEVRLASFDAIHAMGNDRLIPELLDMAHKERAIYRLYAMEAMARYPDKRLLGIVTQLLDDPSKSVRIYAILALARQPGARSLNYNAANRFSRERSAEVRKRVLEAVRTNGWHNLAHLIHRGITDSDPDVRSEALLTTRSFHSRTAALFVSRQLASETKPRLKKQQIYTLLVLGSSGGGKGLIRVLAHDPDPGLRARAAFALGFLKERQGLSVLIESLGRDSSEEVRVEAAWALGQFRTSRAANALRRVCLNTKESYVVRSAAALALHRQATFESKRHLGELARLVRPKRFAREIQSIQSEDR